jgi:hypothetical protein
MPTEYPFADRIRADALSVLLAWLLLCLFCFVLLFSPNSFIGPALVSFFIAALAHLALFFSPPAGPCGLARWVPATGQRRRIQGHYEKMTA